MSRDRTIHNDVVSDVTWPPKVRRGEVLPGVERRRKWTDNARIAIVAEALEPGVVVSHVARRHDLNPSQLFGWLNQYRTEAMALRAAKSVVAAPAFVPAILDLTAAATSEGPTATASRNASEPPSIEISIGGATVRIQGAVDIKTLAVVLKALRSSG